MTKDVQLDMAEIVLDKQFYCFNCKIVMELQADGRYTCSKCGEIYSEGEEEI